MSFYLFRSTSDNLMRAVTVDPSGAALPPHAGPWEPYREADGLMRQVEAVSNEMETSIAGRGYYLMRLGSAE